MNKLKKLIIKDKSGAGIRQDIINNAVVKAEEENSDKKITVRR